MKKLLMLLCAAVLCASLAACGSGDEAEKYEKYQALIGYMEANDYESAVAEMIRLGETAAIEEMIKAGENYAAAGSAEKEDGAAADDTGESGSENTVKAIEITMDNWQTYFEIVEREKTLKNAFDEIEEIYTEYSLALKDGFEMVEYDTDIAVEYNFLREYRYAEIDREAGTMTVGELYPDIESEMVTGCTMTVSTGDTFLVRGGWNGAAQYVMTNFEIVRIKGTLYLTE